MTTPLRVLFVEDEQDDVDLSLRELRRGGFDVSWRRVDTKAAMEQTLTGELWDLVICDHVMPNFSSAMALDVVRTRGKDLPFIIVSGAAPEDVVTAAMRAGAHDFISKGSLLRLVPAVQRELREAAVRRERQQIATRLVESESRYAHLFRENPAPMLLVEAATLMVVDANGAAATFFGHALEILKQASIQALSEQPRVWKAILRNSPDSAPSFADRMFRSDGSVREVDVCAVPLQQGGRSLLLATLFDQTERKAAEESRALLVAAVEQVAEGLTITDANGTISYANQAFQTLTGLSPAVAEGWSLNDLMEREELQKALQQAAQGSPWKGKVTVRAADERLCELEANCSPVRSADGKIRHLVTLMRDITKEAELERELRQSQKMEALGALAAGIAHDSNNILTTILTSAELIKWKLPADSPILPKVDVILQAGLCAAGLNKQILSFSRKTEEQRLPLDLSTIARNALQMLHNTLPANVELQSELMSGVWVEGDPVLLHQIILNLAVNAFHAMHDRGGRLHVTLSETLVDERSPRPGLGEGRYALLTMADTGCGMEPKTLERIFDPFFTTKPQGEGTGLGLSVVHASVAKAGGRITVASQPGKGTEFHIYWPCVTGEAKPTSERMPEDVGGSEAILLVDDEELVVALVKMGLQNLGYTVTTRTDPVKALEEFSAHPKSYDLVFTDLAMPELNGVDLAIKLHEIRPNVPILLMSGLPLAAAMTLNSQARFEGIVAKPFTAFDLAEAARKALTRVAAETPALGNAPAPAPGTLVQREGLVLLAEDSTVTRTMIRTWLERAGCAVIEAKDGLQAWELFSKGPDQGHFALVLTDVVMPKMDGLELTQLIRKADPAIPIAVLTSNEDKDTVKAALNLV
jgi:PAS domain S-box-containing protein